jgi:large subunit ribosomal protein L10
MQKTEKSFFIQNLTEELKTATSFVLVDYTGLSVKLQQELKKRLKAVGANLTIVKNTLFKLAAKGAKSPEQIFGDTALTGPSALVITEQEPIAPLQVIAAFAKEFDIPQFKIGVVEGSFYDKDRLVSLSLLPGKEVLLAQVTGAIASPMYALSSTLEANIHKLVSIVSQASKKEKVMKGGDQ